MICWLPDIPASVTLPLFFPAYDSNGASVTITGLAVTDVEIYKGTSMTQRASDNGYALIDTDGIDLDTRTGIHGFSLDLSDNSDAGFYAAGSFYHVVIDAITVDTQTVRFIFAFRIVAAESIAGTPKADISALGGVAQSATDLKDFADDGYDPSTNKVQGVVLVDTVTNLTNLPSIPAGWITAAGIATDAIDSDAIAASAVTEIQSGLATAAALDTVDNFLDTEIADIQSRLPAALVSGRMDSSVGAMAANVLTAAATAADFGAEVADAVWDEPLSGHTTADTAGSDLAAAKDNTDYPDGYVYLSSASGAAGTTLGVNGTWRNPVSNVADALTLANTVGAIKFMPNSAVSASSGTLDNRVMDIQGGSLTVASSVSLSSAKIYSTGRRGNLYGTAVTQVTASSTFLENLYVSGVIATAATLEMRHCGLSGNVTDSTGGPNASFRPLLIDCYNFKGDGSAVTFNLSSGGHWHLLGWYGDLQITNMAAGQTFYANGWGKLTIAASCTGGTIKHTSHIEIDDQASGAVTTELISEPSPLSTAGNLAVADAILDRSASSHTTNSTLGAIINDWEDGGRLDLLLDQLIAAAVTSTGEPGQGAPPVSASRMTKIDYLYKAWRNKKTQTSSEQKLFADDATTVDQKAAVSDDATTLTIGEVATGP